MEKENKELRAKCVDGAALAKEAADLRVKVEAKEKELATTAEELRVLKEKEAKQGAVLELAETELREQLDRLQEMKQKAEQGQARIAEMEVRSFHALQSSRAWWRCTLPSSATRGSSGRLCSRATTSTKTHVFLKRERSGGFAHTRESTVCMRRNRRDCGQKRLV